MHIPENCLEKRLTQLAGGTVDVLSIEPLGDAQIPTGNGNGAPQSLKAFGYGKPLLISYSAAGQKRRVVLNTAAANHFGHDYRADRAAEMVLAYDSYNRIPQHAHALDVGVVTETDDLLSIADGREFYILTEYVAGQPYAHDLQRLRDGGALQESDRGRARSLATYLAHLHEQKCDKPPLYFRHLRETIGGGEGIMGLTDSYPATFDLVSSNWLEDIERRCNRWRWRLKSQAERCSLVHGDFHPFNVLFEPDGELHVLDRSRSLWGEPADDVSCMAINYLFFSLQRSHTLAAPFKQLWDIFWTTYLSTSEDEELLTAVAPFFAWRALVLASPTWYNVDTKVRKTLLDFTVNVLNAETFDPEQIERYLHRALY